MYLNKIKCTQLLKSYSFFHQNIKPRYKTCNCCNFIQDKVAIVTGGAEGIGLECVKELLRNGVKGCIIGDISREKECMETLKKEFSPCKIVFRKCDVTNKCELADLFKEAKDRFCGVDILLNNAGIMNDAEWEREIATNVTASVRGTYMGLDCMSKHKCGQGGVIVNFASILGLQHFAGCPAYVGTKHFIVGFSRSLGDPFHFKRTGVKILTVCPGVTHTPLIHNAEQFAHKDLDPTIGKFLADSLASLPSQGVDAVAEGLIKMINTGKTGSVWVSEGNEFYEVRIPDRKSFRVCDCCT